MYPANFEYYRAETVEDAVKLLGEHQDAKFLAGGHSLLPMMKLRLATPSALIDVGRIDGLKGISTDGDFCHVGALSTHDEIANSVLHHCTPVVADAAAEVGDPAIRNKGTIGGNIDHADPASDLPAALWAVGATVHLVGPDGAREVAAADFFTDLLETAMNEGEILTHIDVPCLSKGTGSAYAKMEHPASGYAMVGAAAVVTMDGGRCTAATLALNGAAPVPHVQSAVGDALAGSDGSDDAIARAVDGNLAIDEPMADVHASAEYRVALAKVYAKRALRAARDRASG
jgi:carbon-monoxide dehydrogenase medium subunit